MGPRYLDAGPRAGPDPEKPLTAVYGPGRTRFFFSIGDGWAVKVLLNELPTGRSRSTHLRHPRGLTRAGDPITLKNVGREFV